MLLMNIDIIEYLSQKYRYVSISFFSDIYILDIVFNSIH